jgi:hypothetical protein
MNYTCLDNFLSNKDCDNLIDDALKYGGMDKVPNVHGGRLSLASSDPKFCSLHEKSNSWRKLLNKINSDEFLQFCCKELSIDSGKLERAEFYNTLQPSKFMRHFKHIGNEKMYMFSNFKILCFVIYRILRKTMKFFSFSFLRIGRKKPVELLFDYSIASNGYEREIHRDSDSRLIVFIIYFSDLSAEASGGSLDFYKYIGSSSCIPSQPSVNDCTLIEKIEPFKGRLVLFENSSESLHAVPALRNNEGFRNFIYGSYTLLSGKNPSIENSCEKLKTPFDFYI